MPPRPSGVRGGRSAGRAAACFFQAHGRAAAQCFPGGFRQEFQRGARGRCAAGVFPCAPGRRQKARTPRRRLRSGAGQFSESCAYWPPDRGTQEKTAGAGGGAAMVDSAAFCSSCGQAFAVAAAPPMMRAAVAAPIGGAVAAIPVYAGQVAVPRVEYAGFWLRFLALLIDNVVMGLGFILIVIPLFFLTGLGAFLRDIHPNEDMSDAGIFALMGFIFLAATATLVFTWLYHALMESSEWQATPGKKAPGLVVTDMAGHTPTFRAPTAPPLLKNNDNTRARH